MNQTLQTIKKIPAYRISTFIIVGLSLSIGWGIRGNFGHEYGAAFAGCLAAITVALMSGREDWRQRVAYFAFFGALGWGFGASQSYMQVLSYTESGHAISQWYGYMCTFYIGFLWAAMGGAGTAFAAVAPRKLLVGIFVPLLFLFGAWQLLDAIEDPVGRLLEEGASFDGTWSRHKSPLYWFDADYLPAFFALLGVAIYDLYNRRTNKNLLWLPGFAVGGAVLGWLIQLILGVSGLEDNFASALTYKLGDPSYINPETGKPSYDASNLLNNWPQWFGDYPQHVGWFVGLLLGLFAYFFRFGKFRNGASLFAYMGTGWLTSFLALPVLGSIFFEQYGGIRMTPPRSDDWAGITGVVVATSIWMWRNNLRPVAMASLISGIVGGLGFAGMQWIKQLLKSFGNPRILESKGILPGSEEFVSITSTWAKWQGQNWHSFLEQSYGFVNGIAIAIAVAYLATRIKVHPEVKEPAANSKGRWTWAFSALFVTLGLTYFNAFKNVSEWGKQLSKHIWQQEIKLPDGSSEWVPALWDLPYLGRFPGFDFLNLTPAGFFNLTWAFLVVVCILIVRRHYKNPLPIIPKNPLAKGQIIFLVVLWIMIVANFERALVGWHPSRVLTEWVIFMNAILVTALVILVPRPSEEPVVQEVSDYKPVYRKLWLKTIAIFILVNLFFLGTNRLVYKYPEYDKLNHKWHHTRFGPEASWKSRPNLKNRDHR